MTGDMPVIQSSKDFTSGFGRIPTSTSCAAFTALSVPPTFRALAVARNTGGPFRKISARGP